MKRLSAMLLLLLLCTGCTMPADSAADGTTPGTAPAAPLPDTTASAAETDAPTAPAAPETAPETTAAVTASAWKDAYRALLRQKQTAGAEFALIALDADDVPELVILADTVMELYCFDGETATLLLEEGYKDAAAAGQNVCFQPKKGLFATAFSTMGGGSGFVIYDYAEMDAVHADRYYFNNAENKGGELSYNDIWDRAETFGVIDGGYQNVTLSDAWTHIGEGYGGMQKLTRENIDTAGEGWSPDQVFSSVPATEPDATGDTQTTEDSTEETTETITEATTETTAPIT